MSKTTHRLVSKLLRQHISRGQLIGFALANLVGLTIVLLAVQCYCDVRPLLNDSEGLIGKDYLIVTRAVTTTGAMIGSQTSWSEADVADMQQQRWCRSVGRFEGSDFAIDARLGMGGGGMHSQLFFESIPDEFIDIDPSQWGFDSLNRSIPVIVPRDYLSLYNFGYAATQGLPTISEGQAGMIPLQFIVSGNGHTDVMPGRIVGFSNRLNTVVVPQQWMHWAHARYGEAGASPVQRLIVEVSNPGDVHIEQYMQAHHYQVAGDKMQASKAQYFLTMMSAMVVAVGVIISLLAFFVLMLSIYLLLQKNMHKLQDLMLLGFTPKQVARPYVLLVVLLNGVVLVAAVVLMLLARSAYMPTLRAVGTSGATIGWAVAVGVLMMLAITCGNIWAIQRKVHSLWRQ